MNTTEQRAQALLDRLESSQRHHTARYWRIYPLAFPGLDAISLRNCREFAADYDNRSHQLKA